MLDHHCYVRMLDPRAIEIILRRSPELNVDAAYKGGDESLFRKMINVPCIATGTEFVAACSGESEFDVEVTGEGPLNVNLVTSNCTLNIKRLHQRGWEIHLTNYGESIEFLLGVFSSIAKEMKDVQVLLPAHAGIGMDHYTIVTAIAKLRTSLAAA